MGLNALTDLLALASSQASLLTDACVLQEEGAQAGRVRKQQTLELEKHAEVMAHV